MKPRNLIILSLVVAAVAAYIFFYERHQLTSDEARERAEKVFTDFDRDAVQTLEIHNTHGEFRLEKKGDTWHLTSPIDFPADSAAVSSMLTTLDNLKEERRLGFDEVAPSDYGLDEPEMAVIAGTPEGGRFELRVGDEMPLGSNRAVRRGDEDAVILCSGWLTTDVDKDLDDWRSREVVKFVADDVASIQVVTASDRIHVVRDDDMWRLLEPIDDLADSDHIRNLISNLNGLRIQEFLDQDVDFAELGLDKPEYQVTLVRTEGADPVQLDFGSSRDHEEKTQLACRRDGSESFWVDDLAATRLAKAPVMWRSPKVWSFETWDAERFTVTTGEETIELSRADGLWKLPDGGELDYTAVQDRLSALANLEAREYDLLEPGTDEMGRVELELKAATNDEQAKPVTTTYTFYRPLEEGGDAIVEVSSRDSVMSVDSLQAETILANPEEMRKEVEPGGLEPIAE
jgi:hypothetical protein